MKDQIIGCTVVTPAYRSLEREAVHRFKKYTGLPVKVIRSKDKDGFAAKLTLDQNMPRCQVVFFDVDLWLLRDVHPSLWQTPHWGGVHDSAVFNPHAFPHNDCIEYNMDKMRYINSGLMKFDLSNQLHRKVFADARRLAERVKRGNYRKPVDWTDQFYINMALQKNNVAQSMWPTAYNFYVMAAAWGQLPFIPRTIYGFHAAGYKREEKLAHLEAGVRTFGYSVLPMHDEVLQVRHAMTADAL